MRKILIADGTDGFRDRLREILAAVHTVACAADGAHAWELFQRLQPDLLVVELELPEIDGMTLLRQINTAGFQPAVIVLGRLISDYTVDTLIQMKVGYLLRKPCSAKNVAERVGELLRYQGLDESPVRAVIRSILDGFGIPADLDGGKYLLTAIVLMAEDPSQYITKELYPAVGKAYGKNAGQVERSIRNAIEKGFINGDRPEWERCFGNGNEGLTKKPSNQDFILKVVELLRTKL